MVDVMNEVRIEDRHHSMTVPGDMYHLQPEVLAVRKESRVETLSKKQEMMSYGSIFPGQGVRLKGVSSLQDASSEAAVNSTSAQRERVSSQKNRRGPRI